MKHQHVITDLLPAPTDVYLQSTGEYHLGTSWLPANIFVSHAPSPICTPYYCGKSETIMAHNLVILLSSVEIIAVDQLWSILNIAIVMLMR